MDQYLSRESQDMLCKYSAFIVMVGAIITGLRAVDMNIVGQYFGAGKTSKPMYTQQEKIIYALVGISGIFAFWCAYYRAKI